MEKPFCPACEKEFSPGTKFCPQDGAELVLRSEGVREGKVIDGRYRIIKKLGKGGMGEVYEGEQISTGKAVAIKVISKELTNNAENIKRFQREVKIQSKLEHPNIVTLIDFSRTSGGQYYFTMPYVQGASLRELVKEKGRFSVEGFLAFAYQILDGLEYAHRKGIIHRDLKGDNIIIAEMEHQRIVKILDFGLAKAIRGDIGSESVTEITHSGRALGTPAYMAPEQARGDDENVGVTSDIYSIGVVFYQMLTGELPFQSDTPWGVMHKHINEPPMRMSKTASTAPKKIERVIMRCLEKTPEKRFSSALALKRALEQAAGGVLAEELSEESMSRIFVSTSPQKKRRTFSFGAAFLLVILLASIFLYWQKNYHPTAGEEQELIVNAITKAQLMHALNKERMRKSEEEIRLAREKEITEKEKSEAEALEAQRKADEAKILAKAERIELLEKKKALKKKIANLIKKANYDLAADRLTTPAGNNAFERYQAVLAMNPANEPALAGVKKITLRYVSLAENAMQRKKFKKARGYLAKAAAIRPDLAQVDDALEKLEEATAEETDVENLKKQLLKWIEILKIRTEEGDRIRKKKLLKDYIAIAEKQMASRRYDSAGGYLAKAKEIAPGSSQVKRLSNELDKLKSAVINMTLVKKGCFNMGDHYEDGALKERPTHRVCLDGYYIDQYEVTQGQFEKVMGKNRSRQKECGVCPVDEVTWFEATIYCEKLNKRLPTEAEWEYAARSRGQRVKYATSGGAISGSHAKYNSRETGPAKVGSYPPNMLGLYDMSGNVGEWVFDWYSDDYYAKSPEENPVGPKTGGARVQRGGSWGVNEIMLRTSARSAGDPEKSSIGVGFRCAR